VPKAKVTATVQQTTELNLETTVVAQIRVKCSRVAEINEEIAKLDKEKEDLTSEVENDLIDNGAVDAWLNGCDIDGFKVKNTTGSRRVFNKKKFVEQGGDLALFEACHEDVDNKPYTKITPPREGKPRKK
jgi:hypothetical protein